MKKFGQGNWLRNALIVGQFTAAVVLAVSSILVYQQLQFIQNKKLGYNREQVIYAPFYFEEINENYDLIRSELLRHPQVTKVAISTNLPINTDRERQCRANASSHPTHIQASGSRNLPIE